jgi:hypothetical protein
MKNKFLIIAFIILSGLNALAQKTAIVTDYFIVTNPPPSVAIQNFSMSDTINVSTNLLISTNDANPQGWELTLGGGGMTSPKTGDTQFGLDVSLETNPFKDVRSLWIGGEQSVSWTPSFAGYSDAFVEWSVSVLPSVFKDKLYENTGWDLGLTYALDSKVIYSTGPHISLQYYTSDNSFIYGQLNDQFLSKGNNQILYNIGIGIAF